MARNEGSKGCFDFLKLPTLAFELAGEHLAKDLHRIDPLLGLRDALSDGNIS